jgi:4a-hydroxytetrahydrobiopterin dehydratase
MKKLEIEQAELVRKKFTPDWEIRKGSYLYKKVAFNDYNQTLRFLMAIEKPQIKLDHFADFMNFYNELTIAITTHDVKGLTQLDFELALYIDEALKQMDARQIDESLSEKWSAKYKRSINCSNPKGFSQKAHCAGRKK